MSTLYCDLKTVPFCQYMSDATQIGSYDHYYEILHMVALSLGGVDGTLYIQYVSTPKSALDDSSECDFRACSVTASGGIQSPLITIPPSTITMKNRASKEASVQAQVAKNFVSITRELNLRSDAFSNR